ncbi:MAG: large conductance mechanosensitive channel protein MscL [Clostridia bacterium]|nr:large conductance mechanosensitive channel protein MscL [Clostridia bacterium]
MKKFFEEFKAFAMRGNVIDMAIGVVIGSAFGKITTSMVNDIFMPLLGILTGGVNFGGLFYALDGNTYASIEAAAEAGVGTLNYGVFIQNIVDFLLIALCMFLVVKFMNKMHKKPEEAPAEPAKEPRLCPFCKSEIADDATRCPHCTSVLDK